MATGPQVSVPDIAWIRNRVPIADVARGLGLEVLGNTLRCWRPDNHQHGDRTPSVGLDGRRNKLRCFVCDERLFSNVDLVMKVNGCDTRAAVLWIAANFDVPFRPKGARLATAERWQPRYRASMLRNPLSNLVRSGVLASLPATAQSVLIVLLEFADEFGEAEISYGGLARYTGIKGAATIRAALRLLQESHVIEAEPRGTGILRDAGRYRLTLDSPELEALAKESHAAAQRDIPLERELRAERRQQIRQQGRDKLHASKNEVSSKPAASLITGIRLSSKIEAWGNKTLQNLNCAVEPVAADEEHASKNEVLCCTAPTSGPDGGDGKDLSRDSPFNAEPVPMAGGILPLRDARRVSL